MLYAREDGATERARSPAPHCLVCDLPTEATDKFRPAKLQRCADCGLVFRDVGSHHDIASMYTDDSYSQARMDVLTRHRRFDANKRARWTRAHSTGPRLLDVGAGAGFFVEMAMLHGFDASGIEPSELAARYARHELGVDVRTGFLDTSNIATGELDVVSLWHVLEHVPHPVAFLQAIRERLRDGGRLVLEVPNADSVGAEMMKGRWSHLDPTAHVCHFSPRALCMALERAGFEVVHVSTLIEGYYDTPAIRLRPRRIAGRLVRSARLRTIGLTHPSRGELLRAVACA